MAFGVCVGGDFYFQVAVTPLSASAFQIFNLLTQTMKCNAKALQMVRLTLSCMLPRRSTSSYASSCTLCQERSTARGAHTLKRCVTWHSHEVE